ncbi:MAG: cobalt ECF transporter T component CbiQ [Verrucomicrobiota bacterium]|nr:cobalt ECF transporter T component CbiQ [Verrucomicrobiota bacterium]
MSCIAFYAGHSPAHRLDPRARLLTALTLAVAIALGERLVTLTWALTLASLLAVVARLGVRPLARRLVHLNAFMVFLWFVLPWSVPGQPAFALAGIPLSAEGLHLAFAITLKGNAIVLLFTALVATIDPPHLGCALKHLAVPDRLVHLFLFVVRYTDVIHDEYRRLCNAMKARAFRLCFSRHTLQTFGYLVGLLLVRSIERSERVLAAMKCRGFDGRFHVLSRFTLRCSDVVFIIVALCHVCAWTWMELL